MFGRQPRGAAFLDGKAASNSGLGASTFCENGIVCGWAVILFLYNMGLLLALLVGAPVWLLRPRWREGLRERLGAGAARVGHALAGRQQVGVPAVSGGGGWAGRPPGGEVGAAAGGAPPWGFGRAPHPP